MAVESGQSTAAQDLHLRDSKKAEQTGHAARAWACGCQITGCGLTAPCGCAFPRGVSALIDPPIKIRVW